MKKSSHILQLSLALVLCLGLISPSLAQESEKLYQKGLVKEEGEGSLQEAIEIYTQVVDDASAERSLRAKALLHVGICYEKLGQEKAKASYEKLITEFADQEEITAIGRKKLASLDSGSKTTLSDEMIIREVWAPGGDTYGVSPNGRYLNYIDWTAIELAVKDLETGKSWNITSRGTWNDPVQFPDISIWSPDGKQLAYYWFNGENTEIWIANFDGTEDHLVSSDVMLPWIIDWSPDGKHLLAINNVSDPEKPLGHYDQLVLISVVDGSLSILKSFDELHTCHMKFSPDGKYIVIDVGHCQQGGNGDIYLLALDGSSEGWLVTDPANDREAMWSPDGSGIIFLSDRRGSTDLWSLKVDQGIPVAEPELIKSNLGERSQLLGITQDKSLFYNLNNERTDLFLTELDLFKGEIISRPVRISEKDGMRNVNPAWSPDRRYIVYLKDGELDYQLGNKYEFIIYDTETGKHRKLETDLYGIPHEFWWHPVWTLDGKSILVSGSKKDFMRGLYFVDVESGKATPVKVSETTSKEYRATEILPNFSKSGKEVYYMSKDKTTILKRNLESGKETPIFSSKDQLCNYRISPDETQIVLGFWFNNRRKLYTVPLKGGEIKELVEVKEGQQPVILSWTPDNEHVIVLAATPDDRATDEIIRIPVSGGDPEHVILIRELFADGFIRSVKIGPDGRETLFVVDMGPDSGVWALENLFK